MLRQSWPSNDHVIEQPDADVVAGRLETGGHSPILRAGFARTARVVVGHREGPPELREQAVRERQCALARTARAELDRDELRVGERVGTYPCEPLPWAILARVQPHRRGVRGHADMLERATGNHGRLSPGSGQPRKMHVGSSSISLSRAVALPNWMLPAS